jgi:hypothetical protein
MESSSETGRPRNGDRVLVITAKAPTLGRNADLIIDGVGSTTFKGDLKAAVRGHNGSFGNAR